jgi:hypothetical protein
MFNPEIITFDELYERAKYIVENKQVENQENEIKNFEDDNLPF